MHSTGSSDASADLRNFRIHKWITAVQTDVPQHQHRRSSSNAGSIMRADSPLLGFTSQQENASHDPLHRPSPDYVRRLPEELQLCGKSTTQDKSSLVPFPETRIPPTVPEDAEQDVLPSSLMRNQFTSSEIRHPARVSFTQTRPTLPRQPSLPVFRTTQLSQQTFDSGFTPRVRFHSTVTPLQPIFTHFSQSSPTSSVLPARVSYPSTPMEAMENASPDRERQKLDALVVASGIAGEEELRTDGLTYCSSPSQIYLGEPTQSGNHTRIETKAPNNAPPHVTDASIMLSNPSPSSPRSQIINNPYSPRTSISLDDLDEFDEDASYYGKQIDSLFSPYSRPPSTTPEAPQASKWSLSSSVEDLGSKRSSVSKSPKNKRDKFKSFMSRFSPSGASSSGDKHMDDQEKRISRQRSHSDVLETVTKRSSASSQVQTVAYGSWESVPPTPTTTFSSTSMSISTSYSPATPSDNDNDSTGSTGSRHRSNTSHEKLITPRVESPAKLTRDTSSSSLTWSGTNTSVANSPIDTVSPPLMHSVSMTNLGTRGLKNFASRTDLNTENTEESVQEELSRGTKDVKETVVPSVPARRTFRERIMFNNESALSLILGKGSNKSAKAKSKKPKRKLLIGGIEQNNYRKYEAISSWASAR